MGDRLILTLQPAITSWEGHHLRRISASVAYEIASRYAEKVNGIIRQESINVRECMGEGSNRVLAVVPDTRFSYANLCAGFQQEFMP